MLPPNPSPSLLALLSNVKRLPRLNLREIAAVHYSLEVLDADGCTVECRALTRNLILDQGLNQVAAHTWMDCIAAAAVGTGSTAVKRDSGTVTFTRATNQVTASAGFFVAGDVNRLLKFDSGEEMYVTAFTSDVLVTVSVSGTLGASEGTIWYVNEVGHAAEIKRTVTYGSDSGDNGSTWSSPAWTFKHTYLFTAEGAPIVYNEIGWSYTATAGNNLFGRDIITGGIALTTGQQLKVVCNLSVTLAPLTNTAYTCVVTGWTQNGFHVIETPKLSTFAPVSPAAPDNNCPSLEPSVMPTLKISTTADALATPALPVGKSITGMLTGPNSNTVQTYVAGNFYREVISAWTVGQGNSTAIRSICACDGTYGNSTWRILLAAVETKTSSQTLSLTTRITWQRTLVN